MAELLASVNLRFPLCLGVGAHWPAKFSNVLSFVLWAWIEVDTSRAV